MPSPCREPISNSRLHIASRPYGLSHPPKARAAHQVLHIKGSPIPGAPDNLHTETKRPINQKGQPQKTKNTSQKVKDKGQNKTPLMASSRCSALGAAKSSAAFAGCSTVLVNFFFFSLVVHTVFITATHSFLVWGGISPSVLMTPLSVPGSAKTIYSCSKFWYKSLGHQAPEGMSTNFGPHEVSFTLPHFFWTTVLQLLRASEPVGGMLEIYHKLVHFTMSPQYAWFIWGIEMVQYSLSVIYVANAALSRRHHCQIEITPEAENTGLGRNLFDKVNSIYQSFVGPNPREFWCKKLESWGLHEPARASLELVDILWAMITYVPRIHVAFAESIMDILHWFGKESFARPHEEAGHIGGGDLRSYSVVVDENSTASIAETSYTSSDTSPDTSPDTFSETSSLQNSTSPIPAVRSLQSFSDTAPLQTSPGITTTPPVAEAPLSEGAMVPPPSDPPSESPSPPSDPPNSPPVYQPSEHEWVKRKPARSSSKTYQLKNLDFSSRTALVVSLTLHVRRARFYDGLALHRALVAASEDENWPDREAFKKHSRQVRRFRHAFEFLRWFVDWNLPAETVHCLTQEQINQATCMVVPVTTYDGACEVFRRLEKLPFIHNDFTSVFHTLTSTGALSHPPIADILVNHYIKYPEYFQFFKALDRKWWSDAETLADRPPTRQFRYAIHEPSSRSTTGRREHVAARFPPQPKEKSLIETTNFSLILAQPLLKSTVAFWSMSSPLSFITPALVADLKLTPRPTGYLLDMDVPGEGPTRINEEKVTVTFKIAGVTGDYSFDFVVMDSTISPMTLGGDFCRQYHIGWGGHIGFFSLQAQSGIPTIKPDVLERRAQSDHLLDYSSKCGILASYTLNSRLWIE
ncbi:hypothetical protein JCM33374_g1402 [Metschnikowia sp. JCM 33374]|nr:hypothetical protein JCM33374_g1402 [Metschnikowia sp. JCM 33374]